MLRLDNQHQQIDSGILFVEGREMRTLAETNERLENVNKELLQRIAELEAQLAAARNALINGESEAFSAIEMGDGYGSAKEFRENAVDKVFEILSVKRVCFGCGNVSGECVCGVG